MPSWLTLVLIAGALVMSGLMSYNSRENQLRRALRAARRWQIGELPEDTLGRVAGSVQPLEDTLTAPLSGRPCAVYLAKLEERDGGNWKLLAAERDGVPFRISDDSGHALVDPSSAEIVLDFDVVSESGTMDDPTPAEASFLERHEIESKGWVFNRKLRYSEAVIEAGELVAILGAGIREPDPDRLAPEGYRSAPPTRLHLAGSLRFPLQISDDPSTVGPGKRSSPRA